jgi:Transglycosylase SLT domain
MTSVLTPFEKAFQGYADIGAAAGKVVNPVPPHPQTDLSRAAVAIEKAGERWHINPAYLWGIFGVETSYGSRINVSSTGAKGPFQFEPATAKQYGYPTGVNETGNLATVDWTAFGKQADAAAHYLAAHGGTTNIEGAVKAYNPGEASYLGKVKAIAKTFSHTFAAEGASKAERAKIEEAKPEGSGGHFLQELLEKIGGMAVTGGLVIVGLVLFIYGVLVAVRPRETALSPPSIPVVI